MMLKRLIKFINSINLKINETAIVLVGLAVYCGVSLINITKSSIWFDEAFGAYLIRFNWFDIAKYTANDVHPPLYYWFLKLWTTLFGTDELAIRSMSVFFGAIAIGFGYLLLRKLFNQKTAGLGLMLMSLSPMFIRYSQEARMYMLVAAIAMAATYFMVLALQTKRKLHWVIYGILVSLGMWTHYFVALVWLSHWAWRFFEIRKTYPKKKRLKNFFSKEWLMSHIIAISLYLPWLPSFVYQVVVVQAFGFWIPPVSLLTLLNYATNAVYYQDAGRVNGWLSIFVILLFVAMIILAVKAYKKMNSDLQKSFRLILFMAFMPVVLLVVLSMPPLRSTFIDRYLIVPSLAMSMIAAISIGYAASLNTNIKKYGLFLFAIALSIIGISNVYFWGNYNKNSNSWNGSREIVNLVKAQTDLSTPIIINSPYLFYEAAFYDDNEHEIVLIEPSDYPYGSTDMIKYNDQYKIKPIDGKIDHYTSNYASVWYIGYSTNGELDVPYDNWKNIKTIEVKDKISGNSAYIAKQYIIE